MERQYTRIDFVRKLLDNNIKLIKDEEIKRCAYVHLYGVGQAAALLAKEILGKIPEFSTQEICQIYEAIYNHSNKEKVGTPFDEILKDADEMQHYFRNPMEDYYYQKERTQKLFKELYIEN